MISIRTKLLVPVSIISLLMMAITVVFIVSRYHAYQAEIETSTQQRLTRLSNALTDIFTHTSGLAENIGANRLIIDSLLVNNQYDIIENLTPYIELENLDKLVIYTKEGEVFAQVDEPSRFGHKDHLYPWLSSLKTQQDSQCISNVINERHAVLCGASIDSINGVIGYAVAGYYLDERFAERLQDLTFSDISINRQALQASSEDDKITNLNLFDEGLISQQSEPLYITLTEHLNEKNKERDQWILYSVIIIALNVIVISFLFVFFGVISKAILSLNKYARHVEDRDFSYSYQSKSLPNDEIGQIVESFHHIAESYEEFAEICESIAVGDTDRNIDITHAQDNLGIAVNTMIDCLREKTADNVKALTDLNALNEQLKIAKQRSERASEEKSIFLATMSHEIRTPLNGIVGMVHKLGQGQLDQNQSQQLEILQTCSAHLLAIIDDILDFSKIEAGKMDLVPESVDIRLLLEKLVGVFINNAREKNIDLFYQVAPEIPDVIAVDPTRLRQVLTNLLGNAFKFTDSGEIFVQVSLQHVDIDKLQLLFMVKDSGIGIDDDKKPLLFEPFTQADTSMSRRFGGTGLGLAICARLVSLMGGKIWLGDQQQIGSSFYFTIDVGRDVNQYPSELRVVEPCLQGKKIMVITDNQGSCGQVLHQRLLELGMAVAAIQTPEKALADESTIAIVDVVLLALERPSNEVWQYIAALRNLHQAQQIPIIMFANHDESLLQHAENQLCSRLDKPLLHKPLKEKLIGLFGKVSPTVESVISQPINQYQPTILVVDDNVMNQHVILHLLQETGCKVNTCSSGYEALELIQQISYDIIFVDIHMPDMDGLTLAENIRELFADKTMPWMIAMTADSSNEIRRKSAEAGIIEVVTKPVLPNKLEQILDDWQQQQGDSLTDSAEQTAPCLLDLDVLEKYRLVTLEELWQLFKDRGFDNIAKLTQSHQQSDIEQLIQTAHMFKGSALTIGASHLADLCTELQILSEQQQLAAIPAIIDRISQCYGKTVIELERQINMKKQMLNYR